MFIRSFLVTHRADPGGFFLVHLDVESGIKTLQVGAGQGPAGDGEAHFAKLEKKRKSGFYCLGDKLTTRAFLPEKRQELG